VNECAPTAAGALALATSTPRRSSAAKTSTRTSCRRARRAAKFLADAGFTGYYLHATDGGGWQNPELWNDRCALCRKTYGDDRAKADATVFGAMWGALELTLGAVMHMMRIPFAGVWFASAATVLLVAGLTLFPQRGFCIKAGLICMLLKLMSAGGSVIWVMIAIVTEASILELMLGDGRFGRIRAAIAGGLVTLSVWIQLLAFTVVVYGFNMLRFYEQLINRIPKMMGLSGQWGWGAVGLLVLATIIIGMAAGYYGATLGRAALRKRRGWA